jgi:hypothetical protein
MDSEIILFVLFVALPLCILVFVLPISAIVKASGAKRKVLLLENRVAELSTELVELKTKLGTSVGWKEERERIELQPLEAPHSQAVEIALPQSETAQLETAKSAPKAASLQDDPLPEEPKAEESVIPPTAPPSPTPSLPVTPPTSIEERIGVVWFTRIGAVVGMVVAGWFFKYMVDNDWIGPWGRVALGAALGIISLGIGEFFYRRKSTHPMFNQGMLGLGLALLLISTYACFGFYHLIEVTPAFAVIGLLCLFGGALAHYHKSELILVFSLLAAFLNPIMLSTGQDRPVALFSYLLVMTSGGHVLSVINGFRVATFISIAGPLVLFVGWYGRYFDIHPVPPAGMYDEPFMNQAGAYLSMAARWIPIFFASLFVFQWSASADFHFRRGRRIVGTVLLLIAAAASHGAMAALLYDLPIALGIALIAFGGFFAFLLIRYELTEWLFLTMLTSFIILACLKHQVDGHNLIPLLSISGLLAALYFGVFLRTAMQQDRKPSTIIKILIAGTGLSLFLLGMLFLMPDHHLALAGFVTILTIVFLLTAIVIASPVLSIVSSVVGFIGMLVSNTECTDVDYPFLAVGGGWFLVHAAIIVYDAMKRRREWTLIHMFVLSFAGLGFAGLFLSVTPSSMGILRALLSLGEGAVFLAVGSLALKSESESKSAPMLPLGMAALAFTSSLGFLLAGPSLTVAWAAEAAVLAYLASRVEIGGKTGHPSWILASAAVFITALIHMAATDCQWISLQQNLYLTSAGAHGMLMPRPFAHPLAWSLIAFSAAFLTSVFFLRKQVERSLGRVTGIVYLFLGHAAVLWLLIHEFRLMFTMRPDIPQGIPSDEMWTMWSSYLVSLAGIGMRLQTVTTVVMGIYALLLIGLGFIIREAWHRRLGMMLFGATLVKLSLFDIWQFETLFRIIVGGAVAFLLLVGGFLYARFGSRLKSIVSDNGDKAVSIVLFFAISSFAGTADAFEKEKYAESRLINGISAQGDYTVEIDPALYKASKGSPTLSDIRIEGPDGREVPYVVYSLGTEESLIRDAAEVTDSQLMEDGSTRAVIDLGPAPLLHCRVNLDITGSDFLRTSIVESSADGVTYGILTEGEPVYKVAWGSTFATKTSIEYPSSGARYLRITLNKGEDKTPLRIVGAKYEIVGRRLRKDARRSVPLAIESREVRQGEDKREVFTLSKLPERIPFESLRIETRDKEFVRQIEIESSTHKNAWFAENSATVYRIVRTQSTPPVVLEQLRLSTGGFSRPVLRLLVDNGDNPALTIDKILAEYTAETIVLRATKPGPHTLYVGNKDATQPRYDLASLIAEGSFTRYFTATFGAMKTNALLKKDVPVQKSTPFSERHSLAIQIGIVLVALLLLVWTIRLLRKGRKK